jgi:beta-galactosidase/beta-glucuronidase
MNSTPEVAPGPGAADLRAGYPRPQLVRDWWLDLGGTWRFAVDDLDVGVTDRWWSGTLRFEDKILVPFPPESPASGIDDPGFHPVVWYARALTRADLQGATTGSQASRLILHFGAVDYRADVWLAGRYLGSHEGGHTPFSFDVTGLHADASDSFELVVRAEDDPQDATQPRGKQDWQEEPHGIWYRRTTGIWQPVWLEAVPEIFVRGLAWDCDLPSGTVKLSLELNGRPRQAAQVRVSLSFQDEVLAELQFRQDQPRSRTVITMPRQANGQAYETLLWSPEQPRLVDATVQVVSADGSTDTVRSYLGLRSVGWSDGHFMLNDRPYYLRAVLEQGYWPESHLTPPDAGALHDEVALIKRLGFNTVRIHQKVEDPRFLYWADTLGLLVWAEFASAFEFSPTAVERTTREWLDVVRRDRSHPCVVAWVPLNESWGVQHVSHDPQQLAFVQALYHLTRSVDATRPVITNDGWEHADSDIWTIHDYAITGKELAANYVDRSTVNAVMSGLGPLGRRMRLVDAPDRGQPVVVSEFGGISFASAYDSAAWGYATTTEASHFETLLRDLFGALQASPVLAGFCYTQLTDTLQEANGLTTADRRPKLPAEVIRSIVLGESLDTSSHRRPRTAPEQAFTSAPD